MMGETQTVSDSTACGTGGQCDDGRCFLAFPRSNCAECGDAFGVAADSNGVNFWPPGPGKRIAPAKPPPRLPTAPTGSIARSSNVPAKLRTTARPPVTPKHDERATASVCLRRGTPSRLTMIRAGNPNEPGEEGTS